MKDVSSERVQRITTNARSSNFISENELKVVGSRIGRPKRGGAAFGIAVASGHRRGKVLGLRVNLLLQLVVKLVIIMEISPAGVELLEPENLEKRVGETTTGMRLGSGDGGRGGYED